MAVTGWASGDSVHTSHDALWGGRVALEQPSRGHGYRANVDALLLASFAAAGRPSPSRVAFDLGAGAGAVALSLLHMRAVERAVLVEIDEAEAAMARRNLAANGWAATSEVACGDVREVAFARRGEATLVVCNPPYFEPSRGRPSPNAARARARAGELSAFVEAARAVCGRRARACFVYPANDAATLLLSLRAAGLEPKRLRAVHATSRSAARVVLVEAQPAKAGGLVVLPPLVERDGGGGSTEITALLRQ
jgi:tRNA1Val (adenine37-N6)-methyltransferase